MGTSHLILDEPVGIAELLALLLVLAALVLILLVPAWRKSKASRVTPV